MLVHFYTALDFQMAPLTERAQIPIGAVGLVSVKVVNGQNVARLNFVSVAAPLALSASLRFYGRCDLGPVFRIVAQQRQIATG